MNEQIWFIFLLLTSYSPCPTQFSENFSIHQDIFGASWTGSTGDFRINTDGQLQLNANDAGNSSIFLPIELGEEIEWDMFISLDFNPSKANHLTVFLWADSVSSECRNAFFLQFGDSGNDDAIEFYRRQEGSDILLASGIVGAIAERPSVRFRMSLTDNEIWVFSVDYRGKRIYVEEWLIYSSTTELTEMGYFGIHCKYSRTRSNSFFFDDIYIGPPRPDIESPRLVSTTLNSKIINLFFDELLQIESAESKFKFRLYPNRFPDIVSYQPETSMVQLIFEPGLDEQVDYRLSMTALMDPSGNGLDTSIGFILPSPPAWNDLVINEILFNPEGDGADFLEIYNRSGKVISLDSMWIVNGLSGEEFRLFGIPFIESERYLAFTPDPAAVLRQYPEAIGYNIFETDLPSLNNDVGSIELSWRGRNSNSIDHLDYDEDMHHPFYNNVEGVSLERISPDKPARLRNNWTSGSDLSGNGTPGRANSAFSDNSSLDLQIELGKSIFSPNGDGVEDFLEINFLSARPDLIASGHIYTSEGAHIRELFNNLLLGSEGNLKWDGRDDNGEISPIGIYVFVVEAFSINGETYRDQFSFVLADFLD